MYCIEIMALCGITQIIMTTFLSHPLRENNSTKRPRHTTSRPLCTGFWVGFIIYIAVAICPPDINLPFPLAAAVATNSHVFVQWTLAFFLGGLIGLCVVLSTRFVELLYNVSVLLAVEITTRHERRIISRKVFEEPEILDETIEELEESMFTARTPEKQFTE